MPRLTKERIREVRTTRGVTQGHMAMEIGVNKSTVFRWEKYGPPGKQSAVRRTLVEWLRISSNLNRKEAEKNAARD